MPPIFYGQNRRACGIIGSGKRAASRPGEGGAPDGRPGDLALRLQRVLRLGGVRPQPGLPGGAHGRLRRPGEPPRGHFGQKRAGQGLWRADGGDGVAGPAKVPTAGAGPGPPQKVPGIFGGGQRHLLPVHRFGGALLHRRVVAGRDRQPDPLWQRGADRRRAAPPGEEGDRPDHLGGGEFQQSPTPPPSSPGRTTGKSSGRCRGAR